MGFNRVQIGAGTTCILIVLITLMILFFSSFSIILPTYAGIDFNTLSNKIDETKTYQEGRHWLGLGHKFIRYPLSWQILDFSNDLDEGDLALESGTSDGQAVSLEVTIFYALDPTQLHALYKLLGESYKSVLLSETKSELKNTASKFSTLEFFSDRAAISQKMEENVRNVMREKYAIVKKLLLREIKFPSTIESQLVSKVVAAQEIIKNTHLLEVRKIEADTQLLLAEANRTINELLSSATADGELIKETAEANATSIVVAAQAAAWVKYQSTLGNITNDQLIKIQWSRQILRAEPSTKLLVGYDDLSAITPTP